MNRAGVIWVLIAIVIVGLIAFFAFGGARTTEDAVDQTADTAGENVDRAAARTQAATELTMLRARAEAGETYDDLAEDFAQVRARVAAAYQNAEGEAAEEWSEISADFDSFEASARAGTSNFLDSLSSLISRFSADVRVETENE